MRKVLMTMALLCGAVTATFAAGDKEVNVLYLNGENHVVAMGDIDRIELAQGSINVVTVGGGSTTYQIADIDKIELKDAGTTSVQQLKNALKGDVTVRATGYSFDVNGLADGEEVAVYSQSGQLVGKAKSSGGSAAIDASGYANGVYVIKAGARSLKMIKK